MTTTLQRPNIFKISNKELSQDALLTWLLQWADPKFLDVDNGLHQCGLDFLNLVLGNPSMKNAQILSVEAERQWENIDISAKVHYKDGTKTFLVIEDKVGSGAHSDQLARYKARAEQVYGIQGYDIKCCYFKIAGECMRSLDAIIKKEYHVVSRTQIRNCLEPYRQTEHSILIDYIEYIDCLEAAHAAFEVLPPNNWRGEAWVGFFQFIELNLHVHTWHWVNNRSGGFWNLCLTWDRWNECIPVYMQIEQDRLCYKIALGKNETGLDKAASDIDKIQDYVFNRLRKFASSHNVDFIHRPKKFVHKGEYRTLAYIDMKDWCSDTETIIDKQIVLKKLTGIIDFYQSFMADLNQISFQYAEIKVQKLS